MASEDDTKHIQSRTHDSSQMNAVTVEDSISGLEAMATLSNSGNEFGYSEDIEVATNEDLSYSFRPGTFVVNDENQVLLQCHRCNNTYKNKSSLMIHMRRKHKNSLVTLGKMPCLEGDCSFRGNRIVSLISHLIRAHQKKFQCEKVTFQCQQGKYGSLMWTAFSSFSLFFS